MSEKEKKILESITKAVPICQSLTRDISSVLARQLPSIRMLIRQMILARHRKKVRNMEVKSYKENKEVSSLVFLRTKKDIA